MSELAQKLIAENKRTKATFLDLGKCGLTRVPAEVGELVWLEGLSLSDSWDVWNGRHRQSENTGASNGDLTDIGAVVGLSSLATLVVCKTKVNGCIIGIFNATCGFKAYSRVFIFNNF